MANYVSVKTLQFLQARKRKVRIHVVDEQGNPLPNASISIIQKKVSFPFGTAINKNILTNKAYQNWFSSRFTVTVFEDEMKWYTTEPSPGQEDYTAADALFQFAKKHSIPVRGHNVLWDDPSKVQGWVSSLSRNDLAVAVKKRINSVMSRYKGQVIAWDVVNENLHFSFFEDKLGSTASATFYNGAQGIDGTTTLFMNDYNTIEDSRDGLSTPDKYIQKLKQIQSFHGNNNLKQGIGLESHFSIAPDLAYVRSSIDTLASMGLPIWITELDIASALGQQVIKMLKRQKYGTFFFFHNIIYGIIKTKAIYFIKSIKLHHKFFKHYSFSSYYFNTYILIEFKF